MSIINEALKKTQQLRSGGGHHMPVGRLIGSGQSGSNQNIMLKLVIGLVLMSVILGASLSILFYGIWREKQKENPPVAAVVPTTEPPAVAATPPTTPVETAPTTIAPPTPLPAPPITPKPATTQAADTVPEVAAISHTAMQSKQAGADYDQYATTSVGETAPAAPSSSVQSVPKPDNQVAEYIRMLNVNAIRMAGKDSKVFMNKRVFRLNSTVNSELQIKILNINPNQIVFIDNAGIKYIKHF